MRLVSLAILPLALLSACYDTSKAVDVQEAKTDFEQAPLLTQAEYDAARQEALQASASDEPDQANLVEELVVQQVSLSLDATCDQIPSEAMGNIRLVAAFSADIPDPNLIRDARLAQDRLAACFDEGEGGPTLETQTGVSNLAAPAEIQLYFGI